MNIDEKELANAFKQMSSSDLEEWIKKTKEFSKMANKVYADVKDSKIIAEKEGLYETAKKEQQKEYEQLERDKENVKRLEKELKLAKEKVKEQAKKLDLAAKNATKAENKLQKTKERIEKKEEAKKENDKTVKVDSMHEENVIVKGAYPTTKADDLEIKLENDNNPKMRK